ncbi:slipin family protein [archaeon]|nr:MAG: slipin family protein [archaeon]
MTPENIRESASKYSETAGATGPFLAGLLLIIIGWYVSAFTFYGAGIIIIGFLIAVFSGLKINSQWEEAIVLRLGKFNRINKEGLFYVFPIIEKAFRVDKRVITSSFNAEQTLTKDNVPVDVDAILFWRVISPKNAVINVKDYGGSVLFASQTALRDVIGRTILSEMLSNREDLDTKLKKIIDNKVSDWGVNVQSVEIREVRIPQALQDAMSRQAQAERERQARIILGDSEVQIAKKFEDASQVYKKNPAALHLRGMNMLYESLKQTDAIVIVPSSAVETMGLGGMLGTASTAKDLIKKRKTA